MRKNSLTRAFSFLLIALMVATLLPTGLIGLANTAKAETSVKATAISAITIRYADVTPVLGATAGTCLDYNIPYDAKYTVEVHNWYCVQTQIQ